MIKTTDWVIDLGPEGGTQASLRSLRTKMSAARLSHCLRSALPLLPPDLLATLTSARKRKRRTPSRA